MLDASISANTRAVYLPALKNFKDFRILTKLPDKWPVPSNHILLFIAYHSGKGSAASTVSSYISGISYVHKLRQWTDPAELFIVRKALEGLRRLNRTKDHRAPISEELLVKICGALNQVCYSEYETFLFRSVFTLAFYGLFRVGELVYTSEHCAHVPLTIKDIKFKYIF